MLFYKVKFGVRKVFFIVFEMSISIKSFLVSYVVVCFSVIEKIVCLFMFKIREVMESSGNNLMIGIVYVDEFVFGGCEKDKVGRSYDVKKKKVIIVVELIDHGKVKRMYVMRIEDFLVSFF